MTAKIIGFASGKELPQLKNLGEPDRHVVAMAREILEKAEAGEIVGLFAVMHHADEANSRTSAGFWNKGTIGYIEQMKFRLLMEEAQLEQTHGPCG